MSLKAWFATPGGQFKLEEVVFSSSRQPDGSMFVVAKTQSSINTPLDLSEEPRVSYLIGFGSEEIFNEADGEEYSDAIVVFPEDCKEVAQQLRELADHFDSLGG